ncbi:MAG: MATE family efflux transporter [Tissierellaceae bacterium]|nr:MATE family efflux transporter [Tissierellaceae bacterium]
MEKRYDSKIIRNNVLSMIVPITFENILQMAAGVVSMAFVGRINAIAIGAIGISNILYRIAWALFKGLGVGSSAFVARNYGAQNNNKISSVTEQGIFVVAIMSILMQQILYWNSETLLSIFNSSQELLHSASIYLKIISWSLPFAALIQFTAGILQGMGDAKTPMIVVSVLNIVNIIFSFLLIFGNFGFPNLGLRGAGYAYNIAHVVSAALGLYFLLKTNKELKEGTEKQKIGFRKEELLSLAKYGIPTSLELSFYQIGAIFITRAILNYGETAYAAYQLGLQAESVSYMPATGLAIAATAFVGRSLGSNDKKLGKMYLDELFKMTIIITAFAGGALLLFPKLIMRALTDDLEVVAIGAVYLIVMGFSQMPQNLSGLYNGVLRGAGYPNAPLINTGLGIWGIRIPLIILISTYFHGNILWIWLSMALDLFFRFIFAYSSYKRKDVFSED